MTKTIPYLLISGNPAISHVFAKLVAKRLHAQFFSVSNGRTASVNDEWGYTPSDLQRQFEEARISGAQLVIDLGSNDQLQVPLIRNLIRKSINHSVRINLEPAVAKSQGCAFHALCHTQGHSANFSCLHLDPTHASLESMLEQTMAYVRNPAVQHPVRDLTCGQADTPSAPETAPYHYRNRFSLVG